MNLRTTLSSLLRGSTSATLEERNARNLILSGLWLGFIDGGIITYLSVWLARLGATPTVLGLLASGPQLVNMAAILPAGAFVERQADLVRLTNRSAIITRSGYLFIAALPFFLDAAAIPFVAVFIWSFFAIPGALHLPGLMSVIQRAVPPQMRARVNANRWALYSTVGAIAIPTIGWIIDHMPFPLGYQLAFLISFVGALPNLYFFSKVHTPPFKGDRSHIGAERSVATRLGDFVRPFIDHRRFMRFNLATATFRICLSMPAGLFSIFWVNNLHATDTWIGIRGAVGYAALVFGYWFWAPVTNRIGHRNLLYFAALFGFYPIITALSPSVEWLVPAAMIWGFFVAAIDIGFVDMLLAACPEGRQPTFTALANMLASAELFIGPLIGAALAQIIGVQTALIIAGVLQIAAGAFFVLLPSHEEERRDHAAAPASV